MAESHSASQSSQSQTAGLSRELCQQLWAQITSRLQRGEVLLRNADIQRTLEELYVAATGSDPSNDIRHEISFTVKIINRDHPETYLAKSMQNSVTRAFEAAVRQLNWDAGMIQANGARSLQRFSQQAK